MKQEQAEITAIMAVSFISSRENHLDALCAQTGVGLNDLKSELTNPAFLAGVLDFLLNNENLLLEFASFEQIAPEFIVRCRRALPGGDNLWDY